MVATTLKQIDEWYNDPSNQGGDRPKLLSKLALLELCGWIECEFDRLVTEAELGRLNDTKWCHDNVVRKTYGFDYQKHLRPMFGTLFGEMFARQIEAAMEDRFPGELDRLKAILGTLWKKRCDFAHADFIANQEAQQHFDAPSWAIAQLRSIRTLINQFETAIFIALPARAMPTGPEP